MTSGPARRECGRCGRHGYPATRFPDGYLCGTCLRSALEVRGACPGCGTTRALPGRHPAGSAAICRDCAGITRHFTCLRCEYEGNLADGRLCYPCARTQAITEIFGPCHPPHPGLTLARRGPCRRPQRRGDRPLAGHPPRPRPAR